MPPITLLVRATTGKIRRNGKITKDAETSRKPYVTVIGSKRSQGMYIKTATSGNIKVSSIQCKDVGDIKKIKVHTNSTDAWFFTDIQVRIDRKATQDKQWTSFGPAVRWLSKGRDKDASFYQGVPVFSTSNLKKMSHQVEIRTITGGRAESNTQGFVKAKVYGSNRSEEVYFRPANSGDMQTSVIKTKTNIGEVKKVKIEATTTDAWFFTKFEVRANKGAWSDMGPTHQWLQDKPYHQDKTAYEGRPYGEKLVLRPRKDRTFVDITTGYAYGAESTAELDLVLTGSDGVSSVLKLADLPKQGKTKRYTFHTVGIGDIEAAHVSSKSSNGYFFSDFQIQQGKDSKLVQFGPVHQWVVRNTINKESPKFYSFYKYSDAVTLTPAVREFWLKYTTSTLGLNTTQQPRVTFIGTLNNNTFVIDHVPEPGVSHERQFMLTDIGKFLGTLFTPSEGKPWMFELEYKEVKTVTEKGDDTSANNKDGKPADMFPFTTKELPFAPLPYKTQNAVAAQAAKFAEERNTAEMVQMTAMTKSAMAQELKAIRVVDTLLKPAGGASDTEHTSEKVKEIRMVDALSNAGSSNPGHIWAHLQDKSDGNGHEFTDVAGYLAAEEGGKEGEYVPIGQTQMLASVVDKAIEEETSAQLAFATRTSELARIDGTGCHCTGITVPVAKASTRYMQDKIGGICAYHMSDDTKPWCFVEEACAGFRKSTFTKEDEHLSAEDRVLFTHDCDKPLVPVVVRLKLAESSGTDGTLKLRITGKKDQKSRWIEVEKPSEAGKWLEVTVEVPEDLEAVMSVELHHGGDTHKHFKWVAAQASFGGGFFYSFSHHKDLAPGKTASLKHVIASSTGTATVEVSAVDAQTVKPLGQVHYTLLTPSELGMPKEVIIAKLQKMRKEILHASKQKDKMTQAEQILAVKKVIMTMGGIELGGAKKFMPVGYKEIFSDSKTGVKFENVKKHADQIVLLFHPGYAFNVEQLKTEGMGSVLKKRSIMAKQLEHGQMIITLTWNKSPSDLDLYVVAPGKHGDTEVGGGKPDTQPVGTSINWMNRGSAVSYPYIYLDVDATSGFGPETTTVHKPVTGKYKIYVDCYSCSSRDPRSSIQFKNSGATVRVFDRYGMQHEFKVGDAKGTPSKFWSVADRECVAPPPVDTVGNMAGFEDRDNQWNFEIYDTFSKTQPQ